MKYLIITLILGLFSIPLHSQILIGDSSEIAQILKNSVLFSEYVINEDLKNLGNSYTEDGKIFPNTKDIIEGRDTIINYWKMPEGVKIVHHKVMPLEIKVCDDEARDHGYYEGKTKGKDGEISFWKGKYVIVWKKVNGEWKIYLDIWNRIAQNNSD